MGSQVSKGVSTEQSIFPQNLNNEIKYLGLTISSIGNNFNDSSNYNEIIIDNSIFKQKSNIFNNDKLIIEKPISETNSKSTINFIWKEGGNEVFITGTFCDWKQRFKMNKNENNIFEIELFLLKGTYEFKFIVDGIWKCSSYYPLKKDNDGNNNNYIDNTKINLNNNIDVIDLNKNILNNNLKNNIENLKKNYNNIYPVKNQLYEEAPKTPDVFEIFMTLNDGSNQKYLGNSQYLNFSFYNFDESFKNIIHPFHSYLNHLFTYNNMKFIKSRDKNKDALCLNKKNKEIKYIGINCNIKIKNKYISIVYYSPLKKT